MNLPNYCQVDSPVVKTFQSVRDDRSSIPGSVKSDRVATARHRCDVSSELSCQGAEMDLATRYTLRRNTTSN